MQNEIVSFTTREKRPGEIEGKDYIFISNEEFESMRDSGKIAEYTTYYGSASYGITMEEINKKLSKGPAFVVVDIEGKKQLEEIYDNTTSIFIYTSPEEAEQRMIRRGDKPENIAKRLATFKKELENMEFYDYAIENPDGKLEQTIQKVIDVVAAEAFSDMTALEAFIFND
jgi:guanylate kinase